MIPLIVHQLWIDPGTGMGGEVTRNVSAWKETNPSIEHRVWSVAETEALTTNVDGMDVLSCVRACRFPSMQSNLIRLALIWNYGGFWSDLKNRPQRPFLQMINHHPLVLVDHQPVPEKPPGYLTNSFIGCEPRNEFVRTCLQEAVRAVSAREGTSQTVVSGLVMVNRVLQRKLKDGVTPPHYNAPRDEAWGPTGWMRRTKASYQAGGHWSVLQKTQSLYVDREL